MSCRVLGFVVLAGLAAIPATAGAEAAKNKRRPVRVEGTSVDGPLDRAAARKTVEKQAKRFDSCYPRKKQGAQGKAVPRMPGTVALRLFVAKTGRVVAATLERPLGEHSKVTRCLMRNAMSARFGKSARHSTVRFRVRSGLREYGILSALSAVPATGVSNILSGSSSGSGLFKATGTIGRGTGGLGLRGSGGSGGRGTGTIGLGKIGNSGARAPSVRIRTGAINSRGSLGRDDIRRGVRRHMGAIRRCYERRISARPGLAGRLTLTFVVGTRGTVDRVDATSSTLADPTVSSCVVGVFHGLTFPAPPGGGVTTVTYTLSFATSP